ncbi:MAG: carboxylating nicotinate-nucleotide diphosphorylase [Clostridiales bacterium]|nr:carboxylating nicotinate-nucleotide diphosphorylase [Clostridiales bacterium]
MMKLSNLAIDTIILNALQEDMPYGDISTDSLFSKIEQSEGKLIAKQDGVLAGLMVFQRVFLLIDDMVKFKFNFSDGDYVKKSDVILNISGATASILKGERVALNLLQRMCGIATKTNRLVKAINNKNIRLVDTRKTTPNLRILEKYAVTMGGGYNHRFSLSDAVMLKDNHIKAVGSIKKAVKIVREKIPHTMTIEVEAENLKQVKEAILAKADIIMLDNMDVETMEKAIALINKKALVEISGNIDIYSISKKTLPGVDIISSGAITHSIEAMDISLKF